MKACKSLCILTAALLVFFVSFPAQAGKAAPDLRQFAASVEEHAMRLEDSFTVAISKALMEQLQEPSSVGRGNTLLGEITSQAGIFGAYRYSWNDTEMTFHEVSYRSGWRILRCQETGRTDLLSQRERNTLTEAQYLAAGATGSDLEKERYIYDELCRRITYERQNDPSGEKDTAVGGLLNGRADCDGYSDSMLLCCGLAGIPCKYIQGDSLKPSALTSADGGHEWNLVQIAGSWLMCDVTWGDSDDSEISYLYFNLGRDDATDSYIWEERTLFTEIAPIADFSSQLMPDQQPYTVRSLDDVYTAACTAASARTGRITLFSPEKPFWKTDSEAFMQMLHAGGIEQCNYHDTGRFFELSNTVYPENPFCFCSSNEETLAAISDYADRGIHTFSIFFHPSIAGSLFANDHSGLSALLAMSRIENPGSYRYSANSGMVSFTDVAFIDSLPVCAVPEDVSAVIQEQMSQSSSVIRFLLADGADLPAFLDQAMNELAGFGISSIQYSTLGTRVMIYLP